MNDILAGLGVPKELVPATPQEYAAEFDYMTAAGYKLNLLTGNYERR